MKLFNGKEIKPDKVVFLFSDSELKKMAEEYLKKEYGKDIKVGTGTCSEEKNFYLELHENQDNEEIMKILEEEGFEIYAPAEDTLGIMYSIFKVPVFYQYNEDMEVEVEMSYDNYKDLITNE